MRNSRPTLITLNPWLYQCRDWSRESMASKPCGNKKCSSQHFPHCWQFWQRLISNSIFHINPLSPFWQSIIGVKERLGQSPSSSLRNIGGIGGAESMLTSPWQMWKVPQCDWGIRGPGVGLRFKSNFHHTIGMWPWPASGTYILVFLSYIFFLCWAIVWME